MMASFSEGLLLSKKVGLDPNVLVEVLLLTTRDCFIRCFLSGYVLYTLANNAYVNYVRCIIDGRTLICL